MKRTISSESVQLSVFKTRVCQQGRQSRARSPLLGSVRLHLVVQPLATEV